MSVWKEIIIKVEDFTESIIGPDEQLRSSKFSDALIYSINLICNVIAYYLMIIVLYCIAFFYMFVVTDILYSSGNESFELYLLLMIPAVIMYFFGGLAFISLHLAIIYKVWTDIRNNSDNHVFMEWAKEKWEREIDGELRKSKNRANRNTGMVKRKRVSEKKEVIVEPEALRVTCKSCSATVEIPKAGAFRCPFGVS